MKKIIITFLVITLLCTNSVSAAECLIKNDSSPLLKEYLENNRLILREITSKSNTSRNVEATNTGSTMENGFTNNSVTRTASAIKNSMLRAYNKVFSFDSFYSTFEYYIVLPIMGEGSIPYEIKRDYEYLDKNKRSIEAYLESNIRAGNEKITIENICDKVKGVCDVPITIEAGALLQIMLQNSEEVLNAYRYIVTGSVNTNETKLNFVSVNFLSELESYYSPQMYMECDREEDGGFFDRISSALNNLMDYNILVGDAIGSWKDAISLLQESDAASIRRYALNEKRLLLEELGRQGIHGDSQANMMASLASYNQNGSYNMQDNPIYNTFNNTFNKAKQNFNRFWGETEGAKYVDGLASFFSGENPPSLETAIISDVLNREDNLAVSKEIKNRIHTMYEELSSLEVAGNINSSNLISRITKTHIDILDAIDILTQTCEKSVQVCKEQDKANGDCGKCN